VSPISTARSRSPDGRPSHTPWQSSFAVFLFGVPLKGSFLLLAGALVYVTTTTAYGRVISTFTATRIAALFGTAIAP
jgi:hypothetical protein